MSAIAASVDHMDLTPDILERWGALIDARARGLTSEWSAPEAFLCIIIGAAVCDNSFTQHERNLVRVICQRSQALSALSPTQLDALQWLVLDRLKGGAEATLEPACAALPDAMKLPVFLQALDIVLTDSALGAAEAAFLDRLVSLLDLDPATTKGAANAIVAKNRC